MRTAELTAPASSHSSSDLHEGQEADGVFVNRKITTILAVIFIGTIILLNAMFLYLSFAGGTGSS